MHWMRRGEVWIMDKTLDLQNEKKVATWCKNCGTKVKYCKLCTIDEYFSQPSQWSEIIIIGGQYE